MKQQPPKNAASSTKKKPCCALTNSYSVIKWKCWRFGVFKTVLWFPQGKWKKKRGEGKNQPYVLFLSKQQHCSILILPAQPELEDAIPVIFFPLWLLILPLACMVLCETRNSLWHMKRIFQLSVTWRKRLGLDPCKSIRCEWWAGKGCPLILSGLLVLRHCLCWGIFLFSWIRVREKKKEISV